MNFGQAHGLSLVAARGAIFSCGAWASLVEEHGPGHFRPQWKVAPRLTLQTQNIADTKPSCSTHHRSYPQNIKKWLVDAVLVSYDFCNK